MSANHRNDGLSDSKGPTYPPWLIWRVALCSNDVEKTLYKVLVGFSIVSRIDDAGGRGGHAVLRTRTQFRHHRQI